MSNSKLAVYTKLSPNKTSPRNHKIDKITIHHTAGVLNLVTLGGIFVKPSRKASSNYGIGNDGKIGQFVDEKNRAWTSSNSENDHRAITIEVSNSAVGGEWPVSDKAYNALINLCVDICKRNGIKKLVYTGDKSGNLTEHRYFANTSCPGPYLHKRMAKIADAVNDKLAAKTQYSGAFPTATVNKDTGTKTDIKRWQLFLNWYGQDVVVDGKFGKDTIGKTKTFQRNNKLTADGSAGAKTISAAKTMKK